MFFDRFSGEAQSLILSFSYIKTMKYEISNKLPYYLNGIKLNRGDTMILSRTAETGYRVVTKVKRNPNLIKFFKFPKFNKRFYVK